MKEQKENQLQALFQLLSDNEGEEQTSVEETIVYIHKTANEFEDKITHYREEVIENIANEAARLEERQTNFTKKTARKRGILSPKEIAERDAILNDIYLLNQRNKGINKKIKEYKAATLERTLKELSQLTNQVHKITQHYLKFLIVKTGLIEKAINRHQYELFNIELTASPLMPIFPKENRLIKVFTFLMICLSSFLGAIFFISLLLTISNSKTNITGPLYLLAIIFSIICSKIITNRIKRDKQKQYDYEIQLWQKKCKEQSQKVLLLSAKIQPLKKIQDDYARGEKGGIEACMALAINSLPKITSRFPIISLSYKESVIVVDYLLPDLDDIYFIPSSVSAKNSKIRVATFKTTQLYKIYNQLVYDIILAVAKAVFVTDKGNYISSAIVNGYIDTLDKSTGKVKRICSCSLHIEKEDYKQIDFTRVDSYECFKKLKGISAANVADKVAIRPILNGNQKDNRIINGYAVATNLKRGVNLAAMPWQDFENLIRELFEKIFSKHGGSCKVTQTSRDGGVDAIAYNPDPISGGKYIIQAKRYTNVVPPAAVRDLYGTLMNEGANKAILVTTSDYGGDSFKFAQGKPIVLMNGSHLLHYVKTELGLTDAYINIEEAKKLI